MKFLYKKTFALQRIYFFKKKKVFVPVFEDYLKVDHAKTMRKQMVKA